MNKKSSGKINIGVLLLITFILAVFGELYFLMIENKISIDNLTSISGFIQIMQIVNYMRMLFFIGLGILVSILINTYGINKLADLSYRYRFIIAGLIFGTLVFGEIHGSSLLYWHNYFENSAVSFDTIIGMARGIRSDEWAVNTPMMLSQYFNGSGLFPYYSETIRGALTDVFIIYGQPVRDIAVLFRPFHWGYLFLSPAKGLSFFWISRTIGLFLVSFEFAMLFTKKSRILSLIYAILITWAPVIQWWFAINGLVEMLIFGQLALIMTVLYMKAKSYYRRVFYAFILFICAGGYILSFYPAWQVPLGYLFLALFIGTVHENWRDFNWNKKDLFILIGVVILLGLGMTYVLSKSLDTILSILGTSYPGSRFETGGNQLLRFFLYPGNFFFPFARELPFANPCELAVFFDFFPMGILLSGWVLFKERKRDGYLISMLVVSLMLILWCLFQWPEWLAKITLLSYSQAARAFLAVGLLNILLLIRALSLLETSFSRKIAGVFAVLIGIMITFVSTNVYKGYIDVKMVIVILPILIGSFYVIMNGNKEWAKKAFLGIAIFITFISGMFVNPLSKGIDVIYDQEIVKEIKQINDANSGLWVVDSGNDTGFPIINIPIMVGAPTINSTNVYPLLERWHLLDPNKSQEDIYNRYAHISINLVNGETKSTFELKNPDQFTIKLSTSDLELLNVRYILSKHKLNEFSSDKVNFKELSSANGFTIYEIQYNEIER